MRSFLRDSWNQLTTNYCVTESISEQIFIEITKKYIESHRYYHNLQHIYNLLKFAFQYKSRLINYDLVCFAIWFHDVIYQPEKKDNEAQSAVFATQKMREMQIAEDLILQVANYILATKNHECDSQNTDLQYFLDFDLSILAASSQDYTTYCQHIRQEYYFVPEALYFDARKKILTHFLGRPKIYFQLHHLDQYARKNMRQELSGKHFLI